MTEKNHNAKNKKTKKNKACAEASAEEVLREEIFPNGNGSRHKRRCGASKAKQCANPSTPKRGSKAFECAGDGAVRSAPKITNGKNRPKQKGYKMIDPSDESVDGGES